MIEDGVPAFRLVNTAIDGRYRITKTVFSDPLREVVLQQIHFEALTGQLADYQLHAIVAPHLVNAGAGNTGWYGDFKGHQMLFAEGRGLSLAVASSVPWLARSVGYVGISDGWQTLSRGEGLRGEYQRAENGNVAHFRDARSRRAGGRAVLDDRLRHAARGSGLARAAQPATTAGRDARTLLRGLAPEAGRAAAARQYQREQGAQSLSRLHRGAGDPSRRGLGRDHRQPVDSLGLCQGR